MSYALVVYSVPLGELQHIVGSGDDDIVAEIAEEEASAFEEVDQIFEDDEDRIPCLEAIRHIVHGGPYTAGSSLYTFALETICGHIGSFVDNRAFQPPIRWGWITYVDEFLTSLQFPLRVAHLCYSEPPLGVPVDNMGFWPRDHFEQALEFLENYKPDGLRINLAEALATIIGWLHEALEHEDDVLIGIYS
jgi:hypothetical protein